MMMISARQMRKIVRIDEDKCDGCGVCVPDCAEGAIQLIDGKARLLADNLCDGLGNCLGSCPQDAITIEERPADEFDEAVVKQHLEKLTEQPSDPMPCGCPGTMMRKLQSAQAVQSAEAPTGPRQSRLGQWPVQLTLLPVTGPIWQDADVLLAADCVGFAMPDFHERLLGGKALAVACPKLDDAGAYVQKLATIFASNSIKSVTIARIEVPCCGGLEQIVQAALERAGVTIPVNVVIVSAEGRIITVNGVKVAG